MHCLLCLFGHSWEWKYKPEYIYPDICRRLDLCMRTNQFGHVLDFISYSMGLDVLHLCIPFFHWLSQKRAWRKKINRSGAHLLYHQAIWGRRQRGVWKSWKRAEWWWIAKGHTHRTGSVALAWKTGNLKRCAIRIISKLLAGTVPLEKLNKSHKRCARYLITW